MAINLKCPKPRRKSIWNFVLLSMQAFDTMSKLVNRGLFIDKACLFPSIKRSCFVLGQKVLVYSKKVINS